MRGSPPVWSACMCETTMALRRRTPSLASAASMTGSEPGGPPSMRPVQEPDLMIVASPCPTSTKTTVVAPEEAPEAPLPAPPDAVEPAVVAPDPQPPSSTTAASDSASAFRMGAVLPGAVPTVTVTVSARPSSPMILRSSSFAAYHRVTMEPRAGRSSSTVTQEAPVPDDHTMDAFIRDIPKAELHVHIEGTLEPEMLLELGERNGVALHCASAEECRAAYHFNDLQHFLNIYYAGVEVLVTEQDFYELTAAYLRRAQADGARHVEAFFDPQSHTPRGVPFAVVVEGLRRALVDAEQQLGVSSRRKHMM